MKRGLAAIVAFSVVACARRDPPAPREVGAPTAIVVASAPPRAAIPEEPAAAVESSPPSPPSPPACAESEWVKHTPDLAWTKRVVDSMRAGIARKKLVCLFGTATKPNGSFATIAPHDPAFKDGLADATAHDHPEEAIEVRFTDEAMPTLAAVEKALGHAKRLPGHHFDTPDSYMIDLPAPKDVSLRALITMGARGTPLKDRVRELRLDVSDLRGWNPKGVECWDGVRLTVYPPSGDRFPSGKWTFATRDLASGASLGRYTCDVPSDMLDIGRCDPANGEKPPAALESPMASSIGLNLDTVTATRIGVDVLRDGKAFATREVSVRISSGPAKCIASGTWTYGTGSVFLRAK